MNPDDSQTAALVCVAHFINEEEALAFAQVAEEGGVAARVGDARRVSSGFDGTLGGADSLLGYSVYVARDRVAALREYLKGTMEVDPLDPLYSAGRRELTELATGPLQGNLCEQIIAGLILAGRPVAEVAQVEATRVNAEDSHLRRDLVVARWLGYTALLFTALIFVVLVLPLLPLVPGAGNYFAGPWDAGVQGEFHVQKQSLADGVQPYLLTLVPMAIGGALILSRRQLKNGSNRPLYPAFWRRMGYVFFWLPVALLVYVLVLGARGELELY